MLVVKDILQTKIKALEKLNKIDAFIKMCCLWQEKTNSFKK